MPATRIAPLALTILFLAAAPREIEVPITARNGMVVAPDTYAAEAGQRALREGGSAVDAAIAAAFTLSVTYPPAAPLGGGGFLLYRGPAGEAVALDFRETAPRALDARAFLDEDGRPVPQRALTSGLAVGVPGTLAGLVEAHRRWGRLPWPTLLEPAIELASSGFTVSTWLASNLAEHRELLTVRRATRVIFARKGRTPAAGELLVQSDLARTLRRIAREGRDGFYTGPVAEAILASIGAQGGVLARPDLDGYRVLPRPALRGTYRGHGVITFPPPSSGGLALLQMLEMLEAHDLRASGFGSARTVHLMAEIERRAFADRARWLGDPDFVQVPIAGLLDETYLHARAATFDPARATPSSEIGAGLPEGARESDHTLHLSAADDSGAVVALTVTLNSWYGTGLVARGTGILLNNEIDDFSLSPGSPNQWGLVGDAANAIEAGKRPLSSMTPTIVEAPGGGARPRLVLGSPGGPTIITSVLQVIVNAIDHEMRLEELMAAPRFHHQWLPDRILHEPAAFTPAVEAALLGLGHTLAEADQGIGDVNAIALDAEGSWVGLPDPRRSSAARGF